MKLKLSEILIIVVICILGAILVIDINQYKSKPTPEIKWLVDKTNIIPNYEIGLRNDGVVVWHEPTKK